jgi:hypothetical protein
MAEKKLGNVVTIPVRLAFPEVFAPKASVEGGKEKYSVTLLFPKDGARLMTSLALYGEHVADLMTLRKMLYATVTEKWGEDKTKWPAHFRNLSFKDYLSSTGKDGWPVRDGDMVNWDGFKGCNFIRATSQNKPGLVDANMNAILAKDAVFGGLIVRANLTAFSYDQSGNRGVSFGLSNLQILKNDGVSFSGVPQAGDVFGAVNEEGNTETVADTNVDTDFF